MGESSACLMRSLSQPSPTPLDPQEGDPLHHALTASVSFGRFVSESLAWEKWSSFTQNRYLEEVEKYSKPGSVAEKKAYFEAHYKRKAAQKAAASLEQQNAALNHIPALSLTNVIDNNSPIEMAYGQEGCHVTSEEGQVEEDPTSNLNLSVGMEQGKEQPTLVEKLVESSVFPEYGQSPLEGCRIESDQIEGTEHPTFVENQVESSIIPEYGQNPLRECRIEDKQIYGTEQKIRHCTFVQEQVESSTLLQDPQYIIDQQEVMAPAQDAATMEVSAFSDKKKPASSSAKSSGHRQESSLQPPLKPSTPVQPKNGDQATSYSKITGRESVEKKRSTPKSLHMSINFGSRVGNTNKTSYPERQKLENLGLVRNLSRTNRESTKQQTPSRASTSGVSKHLPVIPQPAIGRTKARYPIESAPFNLRTEERAAKRKEKLQQKLSMEAAEKEQLQERLKGKIRNDAKDVWQSITSQGKANASFHQGMKPLHVQMKKITIKQPCSPGIEKKQESEVFHQNTRPNWRNSVKGNSFKDLLGKNHRPPIYSTKLFLQKNSMNENTSPNIQV